jgi:hypothetical protein
MQGGTVEWAGVVGHPDDFTRNWSYTALSRARDATEIFLIDTPTEHQLDRAEIAPDHPKELVDERTPLERLAAAMRQRDDEDLALARIRIDGIASAAPGDASLPPARGNADAGSAPLSRSVDELRTELAELRERIASQPDALAGPLRATRDAQAEAQRIADEAGARITELERRPRGRLRRSTNDQSTLAFERERLRAAERQRATLAEREGELADSLSDRGTQQAERAAWRERVAAIETELAVLGQQERRAALEPPTAPYLTVALGPLPEHSGGRHIWDRAAHRIEAYRFERGITDPRSALGTAPTGTSARAHWQRAQRDLERAQRALGRAVARGPDHQF